VVQQINKGGLDMSIKNSSARKDRNRQLHSGCGESLQSSLRDNFLRREDENAGQEDLKVSDNDASQITFGGKQNYSDE
jgi:hypothetical protein